MCTKNTNLVKVCHTCQKWNKLFLGSSLKGYFNLKFHSLIDLRNIIKDYKLVTVDNSSGSKYIFYKYESSFYLITFKIAGPCLTSLIYNTLGATFPLLTIY